jgi:hypothetical protein
MKKTMLISLLFVLIPFCAMAVEPNPGCGDAGVDGKKIPVAAMNDDGTMFDCNDFNDALPACQSTEEGDSLSDTPFIGASSGCWVTLDYCRDPNQGGFPSCRQNGQCSRNAYKNNCMSLIKSNCGNRYVQWVYLRTYDEWWFLN